MKDTSIKIVDMDSVTREFNHGMQKWLLRYKDNIVEFGIMKCNADGSNKGPSAFALAVAE